MFSLVQCIIGLALMCYGADGIDRHDDATGIRPGAAHDGYGANKSFEWRYSLCCQAGAILCLTAPVTLIMTN